MIRRFNQIINVIENVKASHFQSSESTIQHYRILQKNIIYSLVTVLTYSKNRLYKDTDNAMN
jgi:hypothetical protein